MALFSTSGGVHAEEEEAEEAPEAATPEPQQPPGPSSGACDGRGRSGWMLRETVLGLTNPLGAVVDTQVGYCRPLMRREGILYSLTSVEVGFFHFLTPSFSRQGAYVRFVPLSLVVFHVALGGVWYWPLPSFRVAAYFDADGYDLSWPSDGITNDASVDKEHGGGLSLSVAVTVRAAVTLARIPAGEVELLVLDNLAVDYWYFPGYDYYYNQRADTVLARSDMLLSNTAALLVGVPLTEGLSIRFGATDSLGWAPVPDHLATHEVGGLVMLPLADVHPRLPELTPFLRVTAFTHHWTRELSFDWNFLIGVDLAVRL